MSDKEKIRAEIERLLKIVDVPILAGNDLIIGEVNTYKRLLSFIDSIPEEPKEPVSEELEEAAKKAATQKVGGVEKFFWNDYHKFKAGANWQKQQMLKDTLPYFVLHDYDSHGADYGLGIIHITNKVLEPRNIKPDDVVDILIIKRDKTK